LEIPLDDRNNYKERNAGIRQVGLGIVLLAISNETQTANDANREYSKRFKRDL
jgi:hypothetical protein